MHFPKPVILAAVFALAGSGCGGADAYVFKKHEFDRSDANFNKPLTDRDDVTICYNGARTSDRRVARLAEEECGRFGKRAQVDGQGFGECPLLVPIAARFLCLPNPASPPTPGGDSSAVSSDTGAE